MIIKPSVIGLGYVGLPLFLKLQKKFKCIGYDNSISRISSLKKCVDTNKEFLKKELILKINLFLLQNYRVLKQVIFILSLFLHQYLKIICQTLNT